MNLFRRKQKAKKDIFEPGAFNITDGLNPTNNQFAVSLVYANDFVNTIYPACAACYGIKKDKTYEEKIEYIGKRVKAKHTSILEHSNVIKQAYIPLGDTDDIIRDIKKINNRVNFNITDLRNTQQNLLEMINEVRDCCKYLTVKTDIKVQAGYTPMLVMTFGGSIRGFRYIIESMRNRTNSLFLGILYKLEEFLPKEFMIDFINDGLILTYEPFDIDSIKGLSNQIMQNVDSSIKTPDIDIIRMDDLSTISQLTGLPKVDCLDFITTTVDFKHMSRVITQQVTRHRNGITQESQRYVNYKDHAFNSPAKFKPKYDKETVYHTEFGDYNLQELGDKLMSVYNSLVEQGVDKEDARGYLPQNNQCGNLFMTFTLRSLLVFIGLRSDPHAQEEVRRYALLLAGMTVQYARELGYDDMNQMALQWLSDYPFTFMDRIDDGILG